MQCLLVFLRHGRPILDSTVFVKLAVIIDHEHHIWWVDVASSISSCMWPRIEVEVGGSLLQLFNHLTYEELMDVLARGNWDGYVDGLGKM